ncbi:hypothetical protein NKH69_05665 [Mesorhizobium sp. M0976]|uniref:hypothetical protein n=1 Tax=Mesorhizobium sp. M0976 TaxID=2957038 RepID=UPI00333CF235
MATTVQQSFVQLKSNLEITDLQSETVSTRQSGVRDVIQAGMQVNDTFLTGSYARHTMISPLKEAEIDIFCVLKNKYFHFFRFLPTSPSPTSPQEDQKTSGTAGGTFTSGAGRHAYFNTEVRDPNNLITLSSNQFTPSVKGWVEWVAPAYKSAITSPSFDVTAGTDIAFGTSATSGSGTTSSAGGGPVVAGHAYEIRHKCSLTESADGYGVAASMGTEIYTRVLFGGT